MTEPFLLVDRACFERGCMGHDDRDKGEAVPMTTRNQTLEEVAKEFDKMKVLGDTAASFAAYVRNMKK